MRSILQQRRHMDTSIMKGRDALELGNSNRGCAEILGAAGLRVGCSDHHMVVQAAGQADQERVTGGAGDPSGDGRSAQGQILSGLQDLCHTGLLPHSGS